ncbi:restriction endonuclease subunit S [Pseudomonas chlororaphis]|uniref:restriction endonuclease subunit S n=1 Tax=Pseudomonas chlororaphis TaxID=587753 RepID=UPI001231ED63|nr:restriction endonuclease subunit S [Pseudomonas chlororaphis]KAA5845614.1 restriction endonuclease subunit S [Pseudomonas chlororaphis]
MSWPTARLSECIESASSGFASGAIDPEGVAQIRMNNVGLDGRLNFDKIRYVPKSTMKIEKFLLADDDVLFNATNSPNLVGKSALIRGLPESFVYSNHFIRIRTNRSKLEPGFLARWLTAQQQEGRFELMCNKWVNQASVRREDLLNLALPLPPLPEQRRISAILDKADALRAKRREAIVKLDQLLQSLFLEMFGDPVTNPKGWPIVALSSYGTVATGNTPPRSKAENYGTGIEWIKSDNLNTPHDYVTKADEQLSEAGERTARVVSPGSVLVTCIAGSLSCIGNLAIADRRVAFNQQINAITPYSTPPEFLYFLLKTSKPLIQSASTNGMKGMVNKSKFSGIQLPAPPTELQREFSRIFLKMHKHRLLADAALVKQDALFAGLQQRAFEGTL